MGVSTTLYGVIISIIEVYKKAVGITGKGDTDSIKATVGRLYRFSENNRNVCMCFIFLTVEIEYPMIYNPKLVC